MSVLLGPPVLASGPSTLVAEAPMPPRTSASASTLIYDLQRPSNWFNWAVNRLNEALQLGYTDVRTARAVELWLWQLPSGTPLPSIGIGDDGSVSLEWDSAHSTLHVMFTAGTGEAYGADEEDEWEAPLAEAADKIRAALRAFTAA